MNSSTNKLYREIGQAMNLHEKIGRRKVTFFSFKILFSRLSNFRLIIKMHQVNLVHSELDKRKQLRTWGKILLHDALFLKKFNSMCIRLILVLYWLNIFTADSLYYGFRYDLYDRILFVWTPYKLFELNFSPITNSNYISCLSANKFICINKVIHGNARMNDEPIRFT